MTGRGHRTIQVGLVFGYSLAFCRDILRGIKRFAAQRPDWLLTPFAPNGRSLENPLLARQDGLIGHLYSLPLARQLQRLKKPIVYVSGVLPELPFARVAVDHHAVGRMVAEHFLERGFRQFAFVGHHDHEFSQGRAAGFSERLATAGFPVTTFLERSERVSDPTGLWKWNPRLTRFLASLPKPVAILASHDIQGCQICEACRHLELAIPEQVAVMGVDNDDLLCELARPSLSSVVLPTDRIGYEAARRLELLLAGETPDPLKLALPPVRVQVRQSSDVVATDDADISAAIRWIRQHAHTRVQVGDLVSQLTVGRRTLERKFRDVLGTGVGEQIRNRRLELARALLADTDLPVGLVAERAGFNDSRHLSVAFREVYATTPSAFRRSARVDWQAVAGGGL